MDEDVLIDIVIPTYNRKNLLKRACQSVQKQSYQNWKLWIVDDGSTDGTLKETDESTNKILKEFGRNKLKIIRLKKNKGVSHARNEGIKQGSGKWIALLDSDDEWEPKKLEKQIEYSKKYTQYPLIHCNEIWIKNAKLIHQQDKHKKQGGRVFIPSIKLCCISPSASLIKRSLFSEIGTFCESFPVCEDYEFWLRLSCRYEVGFLSDPLLIKYGGHKDQLSTRYFAMDYWRIKALIPYLKKNELLKKLSEEEKQEVKKTIINKAQILLKGMNKHQNFKNKQEVERIYKEALAHKIALDC